MSRVATSTYPSRQPVILEAETMPWLDPSQDAVALFEARRPKWLPRA